MPVEHRPLDRRKFLQAAGTAIALSAASYASVPGANDRIRIGVLGCGGRAQAHIHLIAKLGDEANIKVSAVCDVWDGHEGDYQHVTQGRTITRKYSQGLFPSAVKAGLDPSDRKHVAKDYRRVLDLKEVDAVCIATPDHWHARMTLDAFAAGKDVLVETPMTRTVAEARAVQESAARHDRVLAVAVQSLADPSWKAARDLIRGGRIGPVAHLSTGVFRNDARGQWRFYRLVDSMTPATIDWEMFLGHNFEVHGERIAPDRPFDPVLFAQWRCDRDFSNGPSTDLYIHPVTRLIAAAGLGFPTRVLAANGLYHERDGRTVPDVSTIVAEFDPGCQLVVTGTTASAYPVEEVIRGRLGAIKFVKGGLQVIRDENLPGRLEKPIEPTETIAVAPPANETEALWQDFLNCVRRRDRNTLCPPDLGAAAVGVVAGNA